MSKLHIETGHALTADAKRIDATDVRFVTEDGRTMFEVRALGGGMGIEVRGIDMTKHGDKIYTSALSIDPLASNCVHVRTQEYGTT